MSDSDSARVSIIVVNYNSGVYLQRCLACLAAQSILPDKILVVDNGSSDGSASAAERMAKQDSHLAPRISFDMVGENLGFAAANNRAVATCESELVALLNPDAFPEPGWLAALLAAAHAHPDAAAFGSRQMLDGTPDLLDGVGDVYHISGLSWRAGHGCPLTPADALDREIFSPCAAAALYRRGALNEVGGFDEDFFWYLEDVDLGFRLRLAGYQCRYVSGAVVWHVVGGSVSTNADFAAYYGQRNLVFCFFKNMPALLFLGFLPAHLSQTIVASAIYATRGQFPTLLKAKWHALTALPHCWQKRRKVQSQRRVSTAAVWRMLDKSLRRRRCWRRSPS